MSARRLTVETSRSPRALTARRFLIDLPIKTRNPFGAPSSARESQMGNCLPSTGWRIRALAPALAIASCLSSSVVAQDQATVTLRIVSVEAIETTTGAGGDEIYLAFGNGQRVPAGPVGTYAIGAGEVWSPQVTVTGGSPLSIELLEYDTIGDDDLIGRFAVVAGQAEGRFAQELRGDGGVYRIVYELTSIAAARQPARRPSRSWAAHNTYEDVTVTDCREDCEEDIGIIFACQGAGQPARVDVPWLATETGPEGAASTLSIVVDGEAFRYRAVLGPYGLVGHVPAFSVAPGEPLIEALQAGRSAVLSFEGHEVEIELRGSRSALEIFKAHCGWNNLSPGGEATTQQSQPGIESGGAAPHWFVGSAAGTKITLTFGIPETDAIGFVASCEPSRAGVIEVELIADLGALPDGAATQTYIQTSAGTYRQQGRVFVASSEWAGVRVAILGTDPVWQAMRQSQTSISYGVVGGRLSVSTLDGADAIGQFVQLCGAGQQPPGMQHPTLQRPTLQQPTLQPPTLQQPLSGAATTKPF